jgi:hypothetical protein
VIDLRNCDCRDGFATGLYMAIVAFVEMVLRRRTA